MLRRFCIPKAFHFLHMTDVEVNWDNQVSGTEDLFLVNFTEGALVPQAQRNLLVDWRSNDAPTRHNLLRWQDNDFQAQQTYL